jgi:hypothetical protein
MSIIDKVVAAVTPPESSKDRADARSKAQAAAAPGDWLSMVLEHHVQLEGAFAAAKAAPDTASRLSAQKKLGILLMGHAIAEEAVVYPAMADADEKGPAEMGYNEQVMVKIEMAELEKLDPMGREYADKLEHIRGAVAHHMYEEEGTRFLELKENVPAADQDMITKRYSEEFGRYVGK